MTTRATRVLLPFLAAAQLSSGCSLAMKRLPASWDRTGEAQCSSSRAAPAVDSLVAVPSLVVAASVAPDLCTDGMFCDFGTAIFVTALVLGVTYGASAISGYRSAARCERAKAAHSEWVAANPAKREDSKSEREARAKLGLATQLRALIRDADARAATAEASPSIEVAIDERVVVRASGGLCLRLHWTSAVDRLRDELRNQQIVEARCWSGDFLVWEGSLDALPTDASQTRCGPKLDELERARQAKDFRHHAVLDQRLPPGCRARR